MLLEARAWVSWGGRKQGALRSTARPWRDTARAREEWGEKPWLCLGSTLSSCYMPLLKVNRQCLRKGPATLRGRADEGEQEGPGYAQCPRALTLSLCADASDSALTLL